MLLKNNQKMLLKNNQILLFGRKEDNSFVFLEDRYTPVTKVSLYDLGVIKKINQNKLIIGYNKTKEKKCNKPQKSEVGYFGKFTEINLNQNMKIENDDLKIELDKLIVSLM